MLKCLDCPYCNVKGSIDYISDVKNDRYVRFECEKYIWTPLFRVDEDMPDNRECEYFKEDD